MLTVTTDNAQGNSSHGACNERPWMFRQMNEIAASIPAMSRSKSILVEGARGSRHAIPEHDGRGFWQFIC